MHKIVVILGCMLTATFAYSQKSQYSITNTDTSLIIFKDTIGSFIFDSVNNNLGNVIAGVNTRMTKYFKYIGSEPMTIIKSKTTDPHYICEYPKNPLIKDKVYPFTVCFCHKGYDPGHRFNKSMEFIFSDGTTVRFRFTGTYIASKNNSE